MADPTTPPATDDAEVKSKFMAWMNEALDARDAKAAADAEASAKADREAAEAAAKSGPGYYLRQFLGI